MDTVDKFENLAYKLNRLKSIAKQREEIEGRPFIQTFKASNIKKDCRFMFLKDLRKANFQGPLNGKYPYCTHPIHKDEYVRNSTRLITCHECPYYRK